MLYGNCPCCHSEIPTERLNDPITVCPQCSTIQSTEELRYEKAINRAYMLGALSFTAFFLTGLMVLNEWGSHWGAALPAKIKQTAGIATASDYKTLSDTYIELGRPILATPFLVKQVQLQPQSLEPLKALGTHLYNSKQWEKAGPVLRKYMSLGGTETKPLYKLAKLFSKEGKVSEATAVFKKLLSAKPGVFQYTVAKAMVDHLLIHGLKKQAIKTIRSIQKLGSNTKNFMSVELKQLKPKRRRSRRS